MKYLLVLLDIFVVCVVFLILCYLIIDRSRFRVERQFIAVKALFDDWMEQGGRLEGCADTAAAYRKTRNISKKYRLIGEMSTLVWGRQTAEMEALAKELSPFCGVYEALAGPYNRRIGGRLRAPLMKLLGFQPLPGLELTETKE